MKRPVLIWNGDIAFPWMVGSPEIYVDTLGTFPNKFWWNYDKRSLFGQGESRTWRPPSLTWSIAWSCCCCHNAVLHTHKGAFTYFVLLSHSLFIYASSSILHLCQYGRWRSLGQSFDTDVASRLASLFSHHTSNLRVRTPHLASFYSPFIWLSPPFRYFALARTDWPTNELTRIGARDAIASKNCSKLPMTNGMGLHGAPFKSLTFKISPNCCIFAEWIFNSNF